MNTSLALTKSCLPLSIRGETLLSCDRAAHQVFPWEHCLCKHFGVVRQKRNEGIKEMRKVTVLFYTWDLHVPETDSV